MYDTITTASGIPPWTKLRPALRFWQLYSVIYITLINCARSEDCGKLSTTATSIPQFLYSPEYHGDSCLIRAIAASCSTFLDTGTFAAFSYRRIVIVSIATSTTEPSIFVECANRTQTMAKMLGPGPFPRRPSGFLRYGMLALLLLIGFWTFHHSSDDMVRLEPITNVPVPEAHTGSNSANQQPPASGNYGSETDLSLQTGGKVPQSTQQEQKKPTKSKSSAHPIDKLIHDAQRLFAGVTATESKTVEEAAQAYRKRRGRHPPPNFDKWYEFAQSHNAIIVEDFFDQIYHDLGPFWGMDPAPMRREASQFEMTINIRNGTATAGSDWFWTKIWLNMTKSIEHYLPDMDLALNAMDEPRVVVPWEEINAYMKNASKTVKLPKAKTMSNQYPHWPAPGTGMLDGNTTTKDWEETSKFGATKFAKTWNQTLRPY